MVTLERNPATGKELLVLLRHEIRVLARQRLSGERPNHTLNTTALVNELYLRLAPSEQQFCNERQFAAAASQIMRRILVDYARCGCARSSTRGIRLICWPSGTIKAV
jgi:RNA polymerase sigma-70 factor, ECF subfamily